MNFILLHFGFTRIALILTIGSASLSGCKRESSSGQKTLDNFAAGSVIHKNKCQGNPSNPEVTAFASLPVLVEGSESNEKVLKDVARLAFSALPAEFAEIFAAYEGKVFISPEVSSLCQSLSGKTTSHEESTACVIAIPQGENVRPGLSGIVIALNNNEIDIANNLLRSVGYAISMQAQKATKQGANGQLALNPIRYADLMTDLSAALIEDVVNSNGLFKLSAFQPYFLGTSEIDIKSAVKRFRNKQDVEALRLDRVPLSNIAAFKDFAVAHALESRYCYAWDKSEAAFSQEVVQRIVSTKDLKLFEKLLNTDLVAKKFFPITDASYSRLDAYLRHMAKVLRSTAPSKNEGTSFRLAGDAEANSYDATLADYKARIKRLQMLEKGIENPSLSDRWNMGWSSFVSGYVPREEVKAYARDEIHRLRSQPAFLDANAMAMRSRGINVTLASEDEKQPSHLATIGNSVLESSGSVIRETSKSAASTAAGVYYLATDPIGAIKSGYDATVNVALEDAKTAHARYPNNSFENVFASRLLRQVPITSSVAKTYDNAYAVLTEKDPLTGAKLSYGEVDAYAKSQAAVAGSASVDAIMGTAAYKAVSRMTGSKLISLAPQVLIQTVSKAKSAIVSFQPRVVGKAADTLQKAVKNFQDKAGSTGRFIESQSKDLLNNGIKERSLAPESEEKANL